jgi:hypothetical protein
MMITSPLNEGGRDKNCFWGNMFRLLHLFKPSAMMNKRLILDLKTSQVSPLKASQTSHHSSPP